MTPASEVAAALTAAEGLLGERARRSVPLGPMTTYRVGGAADLYLDVDGAQDLAALAETVRATGVPVLVVGNGSNLLVADAGFRGLAIRLGPAFAAVEVDAGSHEVTAGASALLPVVARRTVAEGCTGFEWAVGVPGSIGGAVRMNAGGHGAAMADSVLGVRVLDLSTGEDVVMGSADLDFGYRRSSIRPEHLVLSATLALAPAPDGGTADELRTIVQWRRAHQPGGANAGSVFTNPDGDSAGRLIDTAGCRGLRLGTASVSDKHANFFQADPDGSADDIVALMVEVHRRVRDAHGTALHPETVLVGFDGAAHPWEDPSRWN